MLDDSREITDILNRVVQGDHASLDDLFQRYRDRLKLMVRLRINRKLRGRVDDSDVVQDAYLEAAKRLPDYLQDPAMPFFLWLRYITGQKLVDVHRRHLGAKQRDAGQEISLQRGALPAATSVSLAAQLLDRRTSPLLAVVRAETRLRVQEELNRMDPIDREVLALRHFEQLSNPEVAQTLGISESGASSRYLRALKRLKDSLVNISGLWDE